MTLQRLVLDYRGEELTVRVLYRSKDGPNPGTKTRHRAVLECLIANHEEQAAKLMETLPKGAA